MKEAFIEARTYMRDMLHTGWITGVVRQERKAFPE
jgi:hypothetical protein